MERLFFIRGLLIFYLLVQSTYGFAQFIEFGAVHREFPANQKIGISNQRLTSIPLFPFWDDFSKGIDTVKWENEGVSYSETTGINAPSLGMAVFNGVDRNGKPYSQQIRDQGESDYLSSKPIDLSKIASAEKETLFLSFFWQAGGRSEAPDANDRLTLQIFDTQGYWQTIWEKRGGEGLDRTRFFQENLQIKPEWQHKDFRFRFFSSGRQSGPYDAWILDYIYLNTKRSTNSTSYPDRSLTQPNSVRLDNFGAYPLELLEKNQTGKWTTLKNEFLNLENRFRAMEYTISANDSSGNLIFSINSNTPFNPVPNVLERRSFQSRTFEKIPVPNKQGDVFFSTKLTTGDGLLFETNQGDTVRFAGVDFRSNDQVSSKFPLRDFFAYDHGSADYAAGINQRSGQLAVKYKTSEQVYLKGISIYFTNALQANQALDIVVWSKLDSKPIYSKPVVIPSGLPGKEFAYFPIDESININGDFYIGFTQFTNNFIHVGLDKSNDQGDKIFFNVGGGWLQNKEVKGALMLRPHVSKTDPGKRAGILPGSSFKIYPNPVQDELMVEGEFTDIWIVDSFGREIFLPKNPTDQGQIINFRGQKSGVYVVNLLTSDGLKSVRILVSN